MKTLRTILVACAFGVGLAACGDASHVVAPEAPRYDGGFTVGGGNRAMSDTSTTVVTSSTETTTGETTERGGHTFGGGN